MIITLLAMHFSPEMPKNNQKSSTITTHKEGRKIKGNEERNKAEQTDMTGSKVACFASRKKKKQRNRISLQSLYFSLSLFLRITIWLDSHNECQQVTKGSQQSLKWSLKRRYSDLFIFIINQ